MIEQALIHAVAGAGRTVPDPIVQWVVIGSWRSPLLRFDVSFPGVDWSALPEV